MHTFLRNNLVTKIVLLFAIFCSYPAVYFSYEIGASIDSYSHFVKGGQKYSVSVKLDNVEDMDAVYSLEPADGLLGNAPFLSYDPNVFNVLSEGKLPNVELPKIANINPDSKKYASNWILNKDQLSAIPLAAGESRTVSVELYVPEDQVVPFTYYPLYFSIRAKFADDLAPIAENVVGANVDIVSQVVTYIYIAPSDVAAAISELSASNVKSKTSGFDIFSYALIGAAVLIVVLFVLRPILCVSSSKSNSKRRKK